MFKRIYFFLWTYLAAVTYSQTLLILWLSKNGLSLLGILLYYLLQFSLTLFIYFILQGRSITSRNSFFLGILANVCGVFIASIAIHGWYAFVISAFFALNNVFFWTLYNTLYFQYADKQKNAFNSGIYFLMTPILGAIFSPFAGFIAEKFGFPFLFLSSSLLYIVPLVFVFFIPSINFKFKTKEALLRIENKTLIFFQGYLSIFGFAVIPILTLSFLDTASGFGNFFGYLAIISAFAALLNSKISDKLKNRAFFFYFFTGLNSLSYIAFAFVKSLIGWHIFAGINNITENLANPFSIALILDHAKLDMGETMLGRELYLDLGRVAMLLLVIIIFWFSRSFLVVLAVASVTTLFYPLVAYYQKIYFKK